MEYKDPFKKDRKGLYYLDSKDVKTEDLPLKQFTESFGEQAQFYKIEGINDYIIKDCTKYPLYFNRIRNLHLLKKIIEYQKYFDNIEFPVAYYKDMEKLRGIVIPYYKGAISLKGIVSYYCSKDLLFYYSHSQDEIENFISLTLDILELISSLYDKGISYMDINLGNFLLYNNVVKLVDFEPGYVLFGDSNKWHLDTILTRYELLINRLRKALDLKPIVFHSGNDFYETEKNINSFRKKLER